MAGAWCIDTTCNHMGWGALDKGVGKHCTEKMRTPRGLGGYLGCFLGLGKIINMGDLLFMVSRLVAKSCTCTNAS